MRDNNGDLEAVRRLFLKPEFEMLPFRSAIDQIEFLTDAATVTITAPPAQPTQAPRNHATTPAEHGLGATPPTPEPPTPTTPSPQRRPTAAAQDTAIVFALSGWDATGSATDRAKVRMAYTAVLDAWQKAVAAWEAIEA